MNKKPETMTAKEVCAVAGFSSRTLQRRVRDGELVPIPKPPGLKRAYKLEFLKSDVDKLLKENS